MRKYLPLISLIVLIGLLLPCIVMAASYTYYVPITVFNNSTNDLSNLPVLVTMNNTQLAELGYINSSGLDTNIQEGATDRGYMVGDSRLGLFIPSILGNQKRTYNYRLGYSPEQSGFPVIVGVSGNITVDDDATLELGNNFTIEQKGWFDTSAGADKNLVYKQDAFRTYVSAGGSITSALTQGGDLPVVEAVNGGYNSTDSTNHTVNLPSSIVAGNLLQ